MKPKECKKQDEEKFGWQQLLLLDRESVRELWKGNVRPKETRKLKKGSVNPRFQIRKQDKVNIGQQQELAGAHCHFRGPGTPPGCRRRAGRPVECCDSFGIHVPWYGRGGG